LTNFIIAYAVGQTQNWNDKATLATENDLMTISRKYRRTHLGRLSVPSIDSEELQA